MASFTNSSARTRIDVAEASEIARQARGDDPNTLSRDDMQALLGNSALVLDGLRQKPAYFDGRFLTGADLTRDQSYIRQRQADLARAGGAGVVTGLRVRLGNDTAGQTLVIEGGHGITPSGDLVLVANTRSVVALDLPSVERLDATLGLRREPRAPLGRRTGLFVLALRAVEFTANPIAAYPTSITGSRHVEDGDIIEATAITLIPFPDTGGAATLDEARRSVARRIFTGDPRGLPQDALPIAMIAMERGAIRWIDQAMVRRETGADTPLQVSMGARPRALSEAFVLQHREHLGDVLEARANAGLPSAFAAAQYFAALPPVGQLPAGAILLDTMGFRQLWFPPAVDVDISFIPEDEVAALVEESLALPPIDLLDDPEDLDATGVVVLAPVPRPRLQRFESALTALTRATVPDPAQGIRRAPADMLAAMLARRTKLLEARERDAEASARAEASDAELKAWQAAWQEAIAGIPVGEGNQPLLWYVRRRAVADRANIVGLPVAVAGDDEALVNKVTKRITELGLTTRKKKLDDASTPFAEARTLGLLGSARLVDSDVFVTAVFRSLEDAVTSVASASAVAEAAPAESARAAAAKAAVAEKAAAVGRSKSAEKVDEAVAGRANALVLFKRQKAIAVRAEQYGTTKLTEADVVDVASDFGDAALGDGIDRLTAAIRPALDRTQLMWVGDTGYALLLDAAARDIEAGDFKDFAANVAEAIKAKNSQALGRLAGAF
ncbi:hypothetical protein [Sphingomonas kyeonggiensis]|uniref:Uncharacterized protein n=1 Tax=Sphingomonas kyeonggiensis TaxID=1268553 RepID=A0A7W6JVK0_9SPHN|nr:hypothetical protein [Sphingomonas kyeonggiensis]MBB4099200.1 hypothetical protein [Sphingomonas kyeonggiensis]